MFSLLIHICRQPSAAGVAIPQPDSPAEPCSPFQQFLHDLIDDNKDCATDPQQQQQGQGKTEHADALQDRAQDQVQKQQQRQHQQRQRQQQQQGGGGDAGLGDGQAVSEDCQPLAAAAVKESVAGRKGKREGGWQCAGHMPTFGLEAAAQPGESHSSKQHRTAFLALSRAMEAS